MKKRVLPAYVRWCRILPGHLCLCLVLLLGLILPATTALAQQSLTVRGKVTDENAVPLSGVSISLKGSSAGTNTNDAGEYSIAVPGGRGVLVFSFVGMKTHEVVVNGNAAIDVTMEGEAQSLEEVVAIGYGVAKKRDLTGSISTVEGEELASRNSTQVSQSLQGTMPGVMVTRSNSLPGASASILIRGVTTIGNSSPLIIVDGVPVGNIDDVNADDIQDISVLKDAASASIYGARAAAGVILITTKRPRSGQVSLEYNANFGIEKPTRFPEVVGVKRYLEMMNEFTWNDAGNAAGGEYALFPKDQVDNWETLNKENPNMYPITDWVDLLLNDYAPRHSHYLGFTAGSEKVKTRASLNYEKIDAIFDHRTYERIISRVNNNFTFNDYLSANIDLGINISTSKNPQINPVWDAQRFGPTYAAMWDDGRLADGKNGSNAYAALHHGGFSNTWRNKLNGRISLDFKPIKALTISAVLAPQFQFAKTKDFSKKITYSPADDPTVFGGFIAGHNNTVLNEGRDENRALTKQLLATYVKNFGGHSVNLLAGYEDYYNHNETMGARASNYVLSNYPYLNLGPLDFMYNSGNAYETAYRSYFGRLIYDYNNKYFLQANIRHDGSSRFHPDYRWGSFPSISAGWAVTEENFMKTQNIFSHLKLRASWGQLGNERIGNYPYQSSIGYSNALFYQGNSVVSSITAAQFAYAIHDITWEITETANFGLDAYFLNNRLSVSADYYNKTTKAMLLELEIPDYMGFENPQQNTGEMYTKGWDFQLGWRDRIRDFRYSVSVNVSDSRTKMGNLGGIVLDGAQIIREGSEFNEWYGYRSAGLYRDADDVANSPRLHNSVKPGDVKYLDISGPDGVPDGKISPDYDRVLLGGSLPRYLFGGNISIQYKNFDFSLAFQGVGKENTRLNANMVKPFHSGWTNAPQIIDGNYWSVYNTKEANDNAKYPRLSYTSGENNNYANSDFWFINGGYFRLKNVVIGYAIPGKVLNRTGIRDLRVFVSGTDLLSIDRFPKGWDPESAYNTYISSIFNLGLSVKF